MYKRRHNQGFNTFGERKLFKNTPQEKKFNPLKKWFGTVTTKNGSFLVTYEGKFRSEAEVIFLEEARMMDGQLDSYIGVFK